MGKYRYYALALVLGTGTAQAIVIDDFETGSFMGTQPISGEDLGPSSSGFGRTLDATGTGNLTIEINQGLSPGRYSHSQDAGVTGDSMIEYALGGIDLDDDSNAFRLELVNLDLNGLLGITVDGVESFLSTTDILLDNGAQLPSFVDFLYSDFPGVDFDDVQSVKFTIDGNGQEALDATIDNFSTVCSSLGGSGGSGTDPNGNIDPSLCQQIQPPPVPEPTALMLFGVALAGFGLRRFKAKAA